MKNIQNIQKKCAEFVPYFFPNSYASLLSGSFVDGLENEFSDVDLIIFVSDRDTVFNETLPFKGLKTQAIIIPVQRVQEILWVDFMTAKGGSINMYSKGIILSDTNSYLKNLKNHCKKLEKIGAKKLNINEDYMARVKISSLLYDIKGIKNTQELYFTFFELLDLLTSFILIKSGNWCGEGKHKMRQIKSFDRIFYNNLIKYTEEFVKDKNKDGLILFVEKELSKHGGLLPYYSKANSLLKVSSNYLTIEVRVDDDLVKSKNDVISINNIIDVELTKLEIKKSYFFLSKPFRKGEQGNKIYIIISADKDLINNSLIKILRKKLSKEKSIPKLLFPYQFDPKYEFYSNNIHDIILEISSILSNYLKLHKDYIFESDFQISFSLSLFFKLKSIWFKSNTKEFNKFLTYLYKCWLPSSYDNDECFNTIGILKSIRELESNYTSIYLTQQKELKKIYFKSKYEVINEISKPLFNIDEKVDLNDIPSYKTYLLEGLIIEKELKKWVLYKDILYRLFSVILMDNRLFSYIPYVVKKIENK
tara:strand:- start:4426 stop:6027 length:1602 start_codon:yes stop_codon:yes gene_type:complete